MLKKEVLEKLKEDYENVIYAGNGMYICYIPGIGWDLYDNKGHIDTFLNFSELINIYQLITQGGEK